MYVVEFNTCQPLRICKPCVPYVKMYKVQNSFSVIIFELEVFNMHKSIFYSGLSKLLCLQAYLYLLKAKPTLKSHSQLFITLFLEPLNRVFRFRNCLGFRP